MVDMFSTFQNGLNLFYGLMYCLSWWIDNVQLKRMHDLLLLKVVFDKCQLLSSVSGLQYSIYLPNFCLLVLSIIEKGMLQSPTIIAYLSISPFYSVCFMWFESILLGSNLKYTFKIVITLWLMAPLSSWNDAFYSRWYFMCDILCKLYFIRLPRFCISLTYIFMLFYF